MRRGHLVLFISSLLAACGADNHPSGCSLDVIVDGRPAARTSCTAGASAGLTGPEAAADHGIGIIQKDGTGDFTVIILNLSLASPPTARVYDPGIVRSYVGNIHDRAGHAWVLSNLAPGPFQVEVTNMEEIGPEDDLKGGAYMGYRIHGTAKATLSPSPSTGATGTATVTATF